MSILRKLILKKLKLVNQALPKSNFKSGSAPAKYYEKTVTFYPQILEFKVFMRLNNENNRFDITAQNVWCDYCAFFLLLLISEYVQKSKRVDT